MHADEHMVRDCGAVNNGTVSDHAIVADGTGCAWIGVDNGIVLNVGVLSDGDGIRIAPEDGSKPDRRIFVDDHIADGCCVGCHEGVGVNLRWRLQFLQQFIGGHPFKIALFAVDAQVISWYFTNVGCGC